MPPATIDDLYAATAGSKFSSINAPTAGARNNESVPVGSAPIQLYSLATPNGQKVGIVMEELGLDYDAWNINIGLGKQFSLGFVQVNPNSKIPAALDKNGPDGKPIQLFESASICLYFADKVKSPLSFPDNPRLRTEMINWLFWQMAGQGPMTGNFGHFFQAAPADQVAARNYGVARFGMEVQRLCDVLDKHLSDRTYLVGEQYSLADIVCYPWFRGVMSVAKHSSGRTAREFLQIDKYKNVMAWADRIAARPAVQRGVTVCSQNGVGKPWLENKPAETK